MSRTVLIFFVSSFAALAHHGGAEYDLGKTVEFKAKLTKVDLINPHAWLYFDVAEKDGKVSHHRCEMRSVHVLRRSGWTKELFPVGQQITIEASPNRTDPASCYLQTILAADGTRMDRYGQYIKGSQGGIQEVRGPIVTPKNNRPARRPTGEPNIAGDWAPIQQVMVNPRTRAEAWSRSTHWISTNPANGQRMPAPPRQKVREPLKGRGSTAEPS